MKILCSDIETLKCYTLLSYWDPVEDRWYEFSINKNQNDLYKWVKFMEWVVNNDYYLVGFNFVAFDSQVKEWILRNYENWSELSPLEFTYRVWRKAGEIINRQDQKEFSMYREREICFKQIDLFRIHGYGNKTKRTSLKWIEFSADLPDIEPMPIPDNKEDLTDEEIESIRQYCRKDIRATWVLWLHTIGEVDNVVYKGKNKIQERLDAIEEFSLPAEAINYSDVKLGESIVLKGYIKEAGIEYKELYERKKKRRTGRFTFNDCIPEYVSFSSDHLKDFRDTVGENTVNLTKEQEFKLILGGLEYTIAKGGIHTKNGPCMFEEDDVYELWEFDCSSQYPASIVKRELYPRHLGKEWLSSYKKLIQMRLDAKEKGKTDTKYKGISETLKLAINGGGFGKTGDTYSIQYDPFVHFSCTIGNQFEILMLIETLLSNGIKILSANTDGALCKVKKTDKELFMSLCHRWEEIVGNTEQGRLEFTKYKKYIMTSVNDYLALKEDGTLKQKGDFLTDYELNKNKSRRVVPMALEQYYIHGKDITEYIRSHTTIFDFCIGVKASRDYYFKSINHEGASSDYKKIIRYYLSTNGSRLIKVKVEGSEAKGRQVVQCEAPIKKTRKQDGRIWRCSVVNSIDPSHPIHGYNIEYDYYIMKAMKIVSSVQKGTYEYKRDNELLSQLTLF